jgi:hypothetical protein
MTRNEGSILVLWDNSKKTNTWVFRVQECIQNTKGVVSLAKEIIA